MTPFVVYILLCSAATSHAECNPHTALDVTLGPQTNNEIMCGLGAQEMFARTAIQPKSGEYIKISCVRRKVVAQN